MYDSSTDRLCFPALRPRRWLGPALATLVLHVFAFQRMNEGLRAMTAERPGEQVMMVSLGAASAVSLALRPPPAARAKSAKWTKAAKGAKRKPIFRAHAIRPSRSSNAITLDLASTEASPVAAMADMQAEAAAMLATLTPPKPEAAPQKEPQKEPATQTPPAESDDKARYHVSPPQSAELEYDVRKVPHEGNPIYGHSRIAWRVHGDHYVIDGDVGVLFITAMTFESKGMIDAYGVSPAVYSEKRFRRAETATHFQRERNIISFSASTQTYPIRGGEQDRASIVWQLAGIGRGDSAKFAPDAEIDIFVAGIRDGEIWRIHVIGEEDIDTGDGKMHAWHVTRLPRPGSWDQKLDIWLAPQVGWYPVKIRYTETNGDYLDMSVSNLKVADAASASSH